MSAARAKHTQSGRGWAEDARNIPVLNVFMSSVPFTTAVSDLGDRQYGPAVTVIIISSSQLGLWADGFFLPFIDIPLRPGFFSSSALCPRSSPRSHAVLPISCTSFLIPSNHMVCNLFVIIMHPVRDGMEKISLDFYRLKPGNKAVFIEPTPAAHIGLFSTSAISRPMDHNSRSALLALEGIRKENGIPEEEAQAPNDRLAPIEPQLLYCRIWIVGMLLDIGLGLLSAIVLLGNARDFISYFFPLCGKARFPMRTTAFLAISIIRAAVIVALYVMVSEQGRDGQKLHNASFVVFSMFVAWHFMLYVLLWWMMRDVPFHSTTIKCLKEIVSMDSTQTTAVNVPEVFENIVHWSHLALRQNILWVTSDSQEMCHSIAHASYRRLHADIRESRVALVDVSQTRSVFWPLVLGLAQVSPEYEKQLRKKPPRILELTYKRYFGMEIRRRGRSSSTWEGLKTQLDIARNLFIWPLGKVASEQATSDIPRATHLLIVHGIRDITQAEQILALGMYLKRSPENHLHNLAMVVVSEHAPHFRTLLADNTKGRGDYLGLMRVSVTGVVLYSGRIPTPPPLCTYLFTFLLQAVYLMEGSDAGRMWPKVLKLSPETNANPEESANTTTVFFSTLHKAVEARRKIQDYLSDMTHMKQSEILERVRYDDIQIATKLQTLFESNYDGSTNISEEARKRQELNYRQKLSAVPRDHAVTAMNITHSILNGRHEGILNYEVFSRRTHHLRNLLAAQLEQLPNELAKTNVTLASTHPTAYGGFSNIYRGKQKDDDGKEVEVALKVLRHFEDQPAETRHRLRSKFAKEALMWFDLKHPNIVPFLGVDTINFPNLGGAMISPWMPRGNVLRYIAENSPVAPYAVELLKDIISGLNYLHAANIVHGDMCGRNILINELGRASLTDFGLAGLVESEPTLGSSTRGGSARWQSPELIAPPSGISFKRTTASDIWAFGSGPRAPYPSPASRSHVSRWRSLNHKKQPPNSRTRRNRPTGQAIAGF
ncbi:hypothetical protein C8R47DRAFT_1297139 [Mycena vitilis]|nr:hypothetical protein C8R47DRAFT_1297139 [Mycena vitilis]